MFDKVERIEHSVIQHGPNNDRVYLMKLSEQDGPDIIDKLYDLSIMKSYTKIFAKIPTRVLDDFINHDFKVEATIPKFYKDNESAHFVSRFFGATRAFVSANKRLKIKSTIEMARKKKIRVSSLARPKADFRILRPQDVSALADLYQKTFDVYPFPIFDEEYLKDSMKKNIVYFGAFVEDCLVAAASAEKDMENKNAEMTDFATDTNYRGRSLSLFLLRAMEQELKRQRYSTLFTIARAESIGMNTTFARREYQFGGTLINNTLIGESIESMNVWYKHLDVTAPQ